MQTRYDCLIVILYLYCVCMLDQRHICQRLNQFGHGKGTIHGGDVFF